MRTSEVMTEVEEAQFYRMDEAERSLHYRFLSTNTSPARRTMSSIVVTATNLFRIALIGSSALDELALLMYSYENTDEFLTKSRFFRAHSQRSRSPT